MKDFFIFEVKGDGIYYGEGPFKRRAKPQNTCLYAPDFYMNDPDHFIIPDKEPKIIDHFPIGDMTFSFGEIDINDYKERFIFYSNHIESGNLEKAVPCAVKIGEVVSGSFPKLSSSGHRYFLKEGENLYFGSSPEIFLSLKGEEFLSEAVAGTSLDKHSFNESLINEHKIVLRDIKERIGGDIRDPEIIELQGLFHRRATITGKTKLSLLELIKELHPTAALGVYPRAKHLGDPLITNLCKDRGRFGAPIGIVFGEKEAHLVVGIRGIEVNREAAIIRAGSGVIKGRTFKEELEEIEEKMRRTIGD